MPQLLTILGGLQAGDVGCRVVDVRERVVAAHRGLGRAEGLIRVRARVEEKAVSAGADAGTDVGRELVVPEGLLTSTSTITGSVNGTPE
jgi:hypothetical protein